MRRRILLLLSGLLAAGSLVGCQKREVKPGMVEGFEDGVLWSSFFVTFVAKKFIGLLLG